MLLGAGASLYANAPSTRQLASIVAKSEIGGRILESLRDSAIEVEPDFEDVLHVIEELEALMQSPARAPTMLRPVLRSVLADIGPQALSVERFELIEAISAAFDKLDYDSSWRPLYRVLRPHLDVFDIDIFTLNYDLLADVASFALSMLSGKKWFTASVRR